MLVALKRYQIQIFPIIPKYEWIFFSQPYSRWISLFIIIRAISVLIIFIFVNFESHSRHNLPVLIRDDHIFLSLVIIFAFSHGYLNSMIQILTTKYEVYWLIFEIFDWMFFRSVEPYLSATSAVILQLFIFAGCFCGIIGSFIYHFIATLL